ncbi:MAG: clostripain [Ruminococcaceae bacterium]|nr:clostripain [Oscillospiraceae bacterium]
MKKLLAILLAASLTLSMTSCLDVLFDDLGDYVDDDGDDPSLEDIFGDWTEDEDTVMPPPEMPDEKTDGTWAVYWYLCGSDLETNYGAATADLQEMLEVELGADVTVVIETGGAEEWQNDAVNAGQLERYVYNSEGFFLVDSVRDANMGEADTLAEFLAFCEKNYPADNKMMLFWNHGGGSVSGAAFDEKHGFDSLTLDEMYEAFDAVYPLSTENPPFEVIGFDTCLMATLETAYTFSDIGRYLVASEEVEPGNGWNYTGWLSGLSENPTMNGAQLGKVICDTYEEGCLEYWTADEITLSVTDLSKIGPLVDAYNAYGTEALTLAADDAAFFSRFGRMATRSESYGGNTPDQGYTNQVDLGHLVRNTKKLVPESADELLAALNDCVVYRVNGKYRSEATGLSCYYVFDGSYASYEDFADVTFSEPFVYLYDYSLRGDLSDAGSDYLDSIGVGGDAATVLTGDALGLEDHALSVDEDGFITLELGAEAMDVVSSVFFQLAYVDVEADMILMLGRDNDLHSDWENGIFKDNFRGVWGALDGYLCYMEIVYEGEDYNTYSVPILLNDEEYNLRVVYDFTEEEWRILGARRGLEDDGMADKNLRRLRVGDVITTMHNMMTLSGDDDTIYQVPVDTFTIGSDPEFYEADLGDGFFAFMYEMVDSTGTSYFSELAWMTVEGDEVWVEVD